MERVGTTQRKYSANIANFEPWRNTSEHSKADTLSANLRQALVALAASVGRPCLAPRSAAARVRLTNPSRDCRFDKSKLVSSRARTLQLRSRDLLPPVLRRANLVVEDRQPDALESLLEGQLFRTRR